jgi:Uma2 family endonuclease
MGAEVITRLTYGEFRQLPDDGRRYELIRGEVHVSPSPNTRHQGALWNLSISFGSYAKTHDVGRFYFAPLDVLLGANTSLQPDLIFISKGRTDIILDNYIAGAPDLVVEILSPSTAAHDRATKLALYAEAGVPWVWFLDPEACTVEALKLEGKRYFVDSILADDQILTSTLFPEWQLPLPEIFDFRTRF